MQRGKPDPSPRRPAQASHWTRLWSWFQHDRPNGFALSRGRFVDLVPFAGLRGVYVGTDRLFNQPVLVRSVTVTDLASATQFHFESRLVAEIRSGYVPRLITLALDGNRPYHVLRLPERVRPLEPARVKAREALALVRELLRALDSLHGQGVAYRNLRPTGLARTLGGHLMLIDFACARRFGADRQVTALTRSRALGEHDPPEAAQERYDAVRADLFSAGVLARLLYRERRLPGPLAALLAADPRARPASARAVLAELLRSSGGPRRE